MQTVKTAALVVLLISVMYQGYISLTTPPEPLPAEYQDDILVVDEDLEFDMGVPEGTTLANAGTATNQEPLEPATMTFQPPAQQTLGAPFADLNREPAEKSLTLEPVGTTPPASLPEVNNRVTSIAPGPSENYPSTGTTFEVPNPQQVPFQPSGSDLAPTLPTTPLNSPSLDPPSISQATAVTPTSNLGLANALASADRQYSKDQLKEALATLSLFYNTPNMTAGERSELLSRLDPLAREVIYSKRHLLLQPHRVGRSETLTSIAQKYDVSWKLLANVNGIKDPSTLLPGTELKVVRGPFSAQIDLAGKELTLFLGDLYAGRFPIEVGNAPAPKPGNFMVQDKRTDRTFYAGTTPIQATDPNNPYGNIWIDLGGQLCIHGSPQASVATNQGCISLAGDYADDLYGILTQGSSVIIRR